MSRRGLDRLTGVDLADRRLRGIETWDYAAIKHGLARDVGDRLARLVPPPAPRRYNRSDRDDLIVPLANRSEQEDSSVQYPLHGGRFWAPMSCRFWRAE